MKISLLVLVSILLLGGTAARVEASLDSRLIDAAEAGETAKVSKLLSAGASVNAHSPIGKTALMFAAQEGHPGVVETLLDNGAYIEAETSNGCKALYCAAGGRPTGGAQDNQTDEAWSQMVRLLIASVLV